MNQLNVSFQFSDKTALVLGGSRGIGCQIVKDFLDAQAKVYYLSRNENTQLKDLGAQHLRCDVREADKLSKILQSIEKIDFLINCVAINHCNPIEDITAQEWDDVFAVNVRSYYIASKAVISKMKKYGSGKIVNVSSIAGRNKSVVSGLHYTASKSAIIGFTRQLSYDVSRFGINVNAVCPSQTDTDMLRASMSEKQLADLCRTIPIGRVASLREQSQPVLFLCSDASSYITGCIVDVNGGQL